MSDAARRVDTEGDAGTRRLRAEVWERLGRRTLSSRWFYDHRGSELFEQITRLPEYYPTRTELGLLRAGASEWMERLRPGMLLELGAGSARKTRVLLDALQAVRPGAVYVPIDVSTEFLDETAAALRTEYPALRIEPREGDLTRPLHLGVLRAPGPRLVAFLGSTLGNFAPPAAVSVLGHVRDVMEPGDTFLLGADLRPGPGKTVEELEAAYDDAAGVTAAFNLNMLAALNRTAGTDFELDAFRHRAFWDAEAGWIEMHLVATRPTRVRVPGQGTMHFETGESLRTEISSKYDRPTLDALLEAAGLRSTDWVTDARGRYAMVFASRAR